MLTVSCVYGLGNHIELISPPHLIEALEWSWWGQIIVIQAIGFGKIAVIAFLLRIQDRTQSRKTTILVWFLYFIGISNIIININQMILILLQCSPVQKLWNPQMPGTCDHIHRTNNVAYFQGSRCPLSGTFKVTNTHHDAYSLGGLERCPACHISCYCLLEP